MFTIKTLNSIAPAGLARLPAATFAVDNETDAPDGILVRSAKLHDTPLPDSLLAIGRAGAGVNNIPIDKCSAQGIVVFNTPGANSGAVAELTIGGLVLASRNVAAAVRWADGLKGQGDAVGGLVEKGKNQFVGPELRGKKLGVIVLDTAAAPFIIQNRKGIGFRPFLQGRQHRLGHRCIDPIFCANFGAHIFSHWRQYNGQADSFFFTAGRQCPQTFELLFMDFPVTAAALNQGGIFIQFAVQRDRIAVLIQIISRPPIAGFDRIRGVAHPVQEHCQRIDVVLQIQAIGQGIGERFFQCRKTVGIISCVEGG